MNRKICDMCGGDAPLNGTDSSTYNSEGLIMDDKLICDKSAKIRIHVGTCFVEHSTGYGGPPDLCPDCFVKCVRLLGERVVRRAERLK